tara:strand:+ start:9959 stop:11503 length:1545 start_codon:yes stop_codon:yes gene_type:complete
MHKHQLKTLLNFSGLSLRLIAQWSLSGIFLLAAGFAGADCVNSVYPKSAAPELLATADGVLSLRSAEARASQEGGGALCALQLQDLAQLYFWGSQRVTPAVSANLSVSYQYALESRRTGHWSFDLRLLRAVYVLAGLDASYSPEEALRQFQREIDSDESLRRDKATAVLNQLANSRPNISLSGIELYADRRLSRAMSNIESAVMLTRDNGRIRLLVVDQQGQPQIAWARQASKQQATDGSPPKVFLQRLPPTGANGVQDSRQQVWQLPRSVPHAGILISRFRQRDGSSYESRCTANPISAGWLISAAHCLFAPDGSQNLLSLRYVASPLQSGALSEIGAAWLHVMHDPHDQITGNVGRYSGSDIALFKLKLPLAEGEVSRLAAPQSRDLATWADSFAYPSDKTENTLWLSRCRASLWQPGGVALSDLYSLDCLSHEGQSGAALLQNIAGESYIVGILSSRISNKEINQPIFTALNAALIADIGLLIAGDGNKTANFRRYAIEHNLAEANSEFLP